MAVWQAKHLYPPHGAVLIEFHVCERCKRSFSRAIAGQHKKLRRFCSNRCRRLARKRKRSHQRLGVYFDPLTGKPARRPGTYYDRNREARLEAFRSRYREDPFTRARVNLRRRLRGFLRGKRIGSSSILFGCTLPHLKAHLKRQFKRGMLWDNYGSVWHVDHIVPLSKFDLTTDAGVKAACHWTNLQPMFAGDNLAKSNFIFECQPEMPLALL